MVTFDPNKNRRNIADHGIALSEAERFDWEHAIIKEDDSEAYGEQCEKATGVIDFKLYVYIYTLRGDEDHAISLRRANRKEIRRYEQRY